MLTLGIMSCLWHTYLDLQEIILHHEQLASPERLFVSVCECL